ncbi:acyl-CoA thioesterase II [Aliiglaciecola sp. 2_MG-2023]|uniref:acyl-CoA thioesterase n=1 Tax=Alteromonadaceae TaxID=72275 RepID=UPI0026E2F608|nr:MULTISPECIES: acyl-CoA thioesterase II [unclassified Aliiglaciecola]MDO6710503.1 acyl-CoA thioesterase II [Aliiglaciecola sp. 2_MG-2023]MDO6751632.1 acyl-CoA thioesterase II [Aliiglaciecola sp. 1_MG-2023]
MAEVTLKSLLQLEKIEDSLYRGQSWDLGFRALFGGQVMGQALAAAHNTLPEGRVSHSFHSYFLLPGDANHPVLYDVENVRDGRSFSTRRVKAIQNGKNIFYLTASFQTPEKGLEHQFADMPDVPPPQEVKSDLTFFESTLDQISERMQEAISYHKPIDSRTVQTIDPLEPVKSEPKRYIWMRAQEIIADNLNLNHAMLAYASDYHFLGTCLQPHGISVRNKQLRMATIDHAMWFHHPFKFDEWLLYVAESPFTGGVRGLVRGQFFNQKGVLVASTMQEGLMRQVKK